MFEGHLLHFHHYNNNQKNPKVTKDKLGQYVPPSQPGLARESRSPSPWYKGCGCRPSSFCRLSGSGPWDCPTSLTDTHSCPLPRELNLWKEHRLGVSWTWYYFQAMCPGASYFIFPGPSLLTFKMGTDEIYVYFTLMSQRLNESVDTKLLPRGQQERNLW